MSSTITKKEIKERFNRALENANKTEWTIERLKNVYKLKEELKEIENVKRKRLRRSRRLVL